MSRTEARLAMLCCASLLTGCTHIHTVESTRDLDEDALADLCDSLRQVIDKKCTGLDPDARDERGMSADAAMTQCLARRDNAQESFANVCMPSGQSPGVQKRER